MSNSIKGSSTPKGLTQLQLRIVREVVVYVRRSNLDVNTHLTELGLAEQLQVSRSPIRAALVFLARQGVLAQDANRGFFLKVPASEWSMLASKLAKAPDDPLYLKIAQARLEGRLPELISEAHLMRQFDVARSTLRSVLARVAEEGWAAQRVGQGWQFLPMIDTRMAYEESYLFRQTIEVAALMTPNFAVDPKELAALELEQAQIVNGGYKQMTAIELFEANSRFHESLAKWSHNRFYLQAIERVNSQRRLVEYCQAGERQPRQTQAKEHLEILAAIASLDMARAAFLMRSHLDGARRLKNEARFS